MGVYIIGYVYDKTNNEDWELWSHGVAFSSVQNKRVSRGNDGQWNDVPFFILADERELSDLLEAEYQKHLLEVIGRDDS